MPVKKDLITPASIVNQFVNNVNAIILNGSKDKTNPPRFSGTGYYNNAYTNPNVAAAFSNPPAIPVDDLDFNSTAIGSTAGVGAVKSTITGADIYSTLSEIVRKLTRVRNFNSTWYHKTQGSYTLMSYITGKATFKETLPPVPGVNNVDNTATSGWTRSVNGKSTQAVTVNNPGVVKGSAIVATTINTFFDNLNKSWAAVTENDIQYVFYSCHNNCHSNCHSSCHSSGRSRR